MKTLLNILLLFSSFTTLFANENLYLEAFVGRNDTLAIYAADFNFSGAAFADLERPLLPLLMQRGRSDFGCLRVKCVGTLKRKFG